MRKLTTAAVTLALALASGAAFADVSISRLRLGVTASFDSTVRSNRCIVGNINRP